jgi:hypothetical protein
MPCLPAPGVSGLPVAAQAPLLECWTQHSAELILTITRFFQKARR